MTRILIFGGHGKVALLLEPLLAAHGHTVTAVIRNPAHTADVEAAGASALVADVEAMDAAALAEIVRGHDAIVWSAGAGGGDPERTYAVDRDAAIRTINDYVDVYLERARPARGARKTLNGRDARNGRARRKAG